MVEGGEFGGQKFKLKEENLVATSAPAALKLSIIGATVVLKGLKGKPEMNGATGVVLSRDIPSGRFEVKLSATGKYGGRVFKLLETNLDIERAGSI